MTPEQSAPLADEVEAFRTIILAKLTYSIGKDPEHASDHDWFEAVALATRDRMIDQWMDRTREAYRQGKKRVYYLSLEFLIGRLLIDSLSNLGLLETARLALAGIDVDFERIRLTEPDAALGNGGLGRLAACFMESMATLGIAAHGYGIRYDHGLFRQAIVDGWHASRAADAPGFFAGADFTDFKTRAEALAQSDMQGHLILKERDTDGDLKCILRGISEDIPKKIAAVEAATSPALRATALSELSYLLNDNVEVITAPPQPEV